MKRIIALCCTSLSLLGQAQTAQVHIAGSNYPTEFADAKLSLTNRYRIASDLTVALSLGASFEELKGSEVETGVFQLKDETMLDWEEREKITLIDQNNQKSLRVAKGLSDNYLKAFALVDAHTNAIQKANKFVAMLNSTNLLSQPIDAIVQKVRHAPNGNTGVLSDNAIRELFEEPQQVKFPGYSVLHFSVQQLSEFNNEEVPVIHPFFIINKSDPSKTIAAPIDFYNGKWGFGRSPW